MLTHEQALDRLLAAAQPVTEQRDLPLDAVRGRVLARPQMSGIAVPPHDNSAMDGYAVRCLDVPVAGARLPVSQRIPAGTVGAALVAGTAARIFTGAPIPPGADAVVMQEQCRVEPSGEVIIEAVPQVGQNIRRRGEDIAAGAEVLPAGRRLRAVDLGLAASVGLPTLPVWRRLRVALMSTGDELVEPGELLPTGAIYNSNRYFLRSLLEDLGCEVTDLGRVPDTLAATRAALQIAAAGNDLILSTGGVSVGEEDHVKAAIEAEGTLDLWKVAIKPGKPLAFGNVGAGETADFAKQADFIGLPGNPVASFVTFLIMVRPFILKRMGVSDWQVKPRRLIVASDWLKPDARREFLRARVNGAGEVELFPNQSSGVLTSCNWADGLIDCPPGQAFQRGDTVSFLAFADLM